MRSAEDIVKQYCNDIITGIIPSGRYIRLAVERFLNDCESPDYTIDWQEVENIYKLALMLKHYEGDCAGQPFILEPWQLFIAANIFCVKDLNGNRKYRTSFIKIAKKNGKSLFSVLLLLYGILSDPASPQGYFVSNSRQQSQICFRMLCHLCSQLDPKQKKIKQLRNEVRIKTNDALIRILSSENKTIDGISCCFGIIDEYENFDTNEIYENLASSMAAKSNGHIIIIGTAGFDKSSPDYEMLQHCRKILDMEIDEPTVFAALYMMDDEDNPYDEDNWVKANPNLGKSVNLAFLRERVNTARTSASQEVGVLTKNLNRYVDNATTWISSEILDRQSFVFDYEDFVKNRNDYLTFVGIDLSSVSDFSAMSILFVKKNLSSYYFYSKVYLPESALQESPIKDKYKLWAKQGYLTITDGNVIDYDYILNDLKMWHKDFQFIWAGYDRYNATQFVISAEENGLPMENYPQNLLYFNKPTRELERLLRKGLCFIDSNPVTKFCFSNVELKSDWNSNVKPFKNGSDRTHKIDIVVSQLEALGEFLKYMSWD
jgi:phage terminase large subunit-like protein